MKQWAKTQVTNTKEGFTTLTNSKKRKEAFELIDTYGSESDKILARVAAGTALVAGTTAVAATAVYAAPIVSAAMLTASAQAYSAISTTALGTYLWNNPDVGLDAYNLGSDIYNRNWGNISTDILAFAYNGANYGSNYRTGKAANTQLEPTETQRNYNAVMAGRGSGVEVSDVKQGLKIDNLPLAKPGEDLYVGTYNQVRGANLKSGLNSTHTPHHAVQNAVSQTTHGKGITININKDIHELTGTMRSVRDLANPRQHLAADLRELRNLFKDAGYNRSVVNRQLWELSKRNQSMGGFVK